MPTRITVRYLGSEVGKKVARPDTKGEVLELAAKRLNLFTPASRIFAASPTSGLYCTIGRRLCRPTGDVDGTQRLEGTCEPRTRTSTENGAFHPHCCTGAIGAISRMVRDPAIVSPALTGVFIGGVYITNTVQDRGVRC